jgi:hypothetical protein
VTDESVVTVNEQEDDVDSAKVIATTSERCVSIRVGNMAKVTMNSKNIQKCSKSGHILSNEDDM